MITLPITAEQVERASELYPFDALENSITKGGSQIYGAMGEVVFGDFYSDRYERKDTYDYDFWNPRNGTTVDVKTKRTTAVPRGNWNCSVAAFNTRQACDYYFFVRVMEDLSTAFLLGYLGKEEFYEMADFRKKGEPDPLKKGWKFTADCYNIPISKLHSVAL